MQNERDVLARGRYQQILHGPELAARQECGGAPAGERQAGSRGDDATRALGCLGGQRFAEKIAGAVVDLVQPHGIGLGRRGLGRLGGGVGIRAGSSSGIAPVLETLLLRGHQHHFGEAIERQFAVFRNQYAGAAEAES